MEPARDIEPGDVEQAQRLLADVWWGGLVALPDSDLAKIRQAYMLLGGDAYACTQPEVPTNA
jgi:hypothetical protein